MSVSDKNERERERDRDIERKRERERESEDIFIQYIIKRVSEIMRVRENKRGRNI